VLAFVPYLAVSGVYLVAILTGATPVADVTKALLMPALILAFAVSVRSRGTHGLSTPRPLAVILTLAGLTLSWAGDVALASSFELGLACFLVAHLFYIALFWTCFHRRPSWWGLLALPWFAALLWLLAPSLGELLPIVALYGAVLGAMAVSATRGNLYTVLGGVFFVVSDSMLAFRLFTPLFQSPPEDAVIMTAYLLAQAFIVLGVLHAGAEATHGIPKPADARAGA
jgi:uncharacterized membrane protein YhhN